MSEFPKQFAYPDPLVTISTETLNSLGGVPHGGMGTGSNTHPTSNLAVFIPFRISRPIIVSTLAAFNGAAVSGNIDIGIYSFDGTKIISTGSTAQSGTSVWQTFSITPTEIGPGLFYLAVALNNTTGTLISNLSSVNVCRVSGMQQMASAFPLPAIATFASITNTFMPHIALTTRSIF